MRWPLVNFIEFSDMRSFLKSFRHAVSGIAYTFRSERNFQLEAGMALGVFWLMFVLPTTSIERAVLMLFIALVLAFEMLNTAFERTLDMLKPSVHPYVKVIKDLVAGAVLLISLLAVMAGLVILVPAVMRVV